MERERDAPRDAAKVLRLEAAKVTGWAVSHSLTLCTCVIAIFVVAASVQATLTHCIGAALPGCRSAVAIAQVEPERAVVPEHAAHLAEHLDHARDERLRGTLKPELAIDAIVPQTPVRRRRDARLNASRLHSGEHVERVAGSDAPPHIANQFTGCWSTTSRFPRCRSRHRARAPDMSNSRPASPFVNALPRGMCTRHFSSARICAGDAGCCRHGASALHAHRPPFCNTRFSATVSAMSFCPQSHTREGGSVLDRGSNTARHSP
uniref:Cellulase n=1 Tax=uncultured marine virus TaxID=186617 RepID=A0A0F7L551_9VIRU|nr:cellulase [uncultured marine virus]